MMALSSWCEISPLYCSVVNSQVCEQKPLHMTENNPMDSNMVFFKTHFHFEMPENDSKRARALKKAAEERETRRAKNKEIARYVQMAQWRFPREEVGNARRKI